MKRIFWKLVMPVISAVIGIAAANVYNLFDFISFIPKEYSYEICMTVYFAVADVILEAAMEFCIDWLTSHYFSKIEIVLFQPNAEADIQIHPTLVFNSVDQTESGISIKVKGYKKHFKDTRIRIKSPAFADIQSNYRRREVSVIDDSYYISLEALFGGNEYACFTQKFRIILAQIPVDGDSIVKIEPEIEKKRWNVIYKHNYVQIKAVKK